MAIRLPHCSTQMNRSLPGSPWANPPGEPDPRFRLDSARLPQRLEFELPEAVIEAITRQAQRSNRSFNEMVQHLLAQSL
jgi:hypothetical protein